MSVENHIASAIGVCRRMPAMKSERGKQPKPANVVSRGRFFWASFSFLIMRVSLVAVLGLVGFILLQTEEHKSITETAVLALAISGGILVLSGINVLVNARRVTCPLCRASLFMSSRGLTKPGVPKFLGCPKTPLALSLLTMPKVMACPCCAERVRLVRSS